jgi:hypothetical protein
VTVGILSLILIRFQVLQYAQSDFIKDAGMQISTQPISINGKVLSPPELSYGQQTVVVSSLFFSTDLLSTIFHADASTRRMEHDGEDVLHAC